MHVLIQDISHAILTKIRFITDKCRSPYQGGCADLNRECSYTELDFSCDDCISGYTEVVGSCVQGQPIPSMSIHALCKVQSLITITLPTLYYVH